MKASGRHLSFNLFWQITTWNAMKANFKGLELDSPPHFVCDFSRKMFLLL